MRRCRTRPCVRALRRPRASPSSVCVCCSSTALLRSHAVCCSTLLPVSPLSLSVCFFVSLSVSLCCTSLRVCLFVSAVRAASIFFPLSMFVANWYVIQRRGGGCIVAYKLGSRADRSRAEAEEPDCAVQHGLGYVFILSALRCLSRVPFLCIACLDLSCLVFKGRLGLLVFLFMAPCRFAGGGN